MSYDQSPFDPQWDKYKKNPYQIPAREPQDLHKRQVAKTVPLTIEDLFPKLDRWAIGYTSTFDTLRQLSAAAKTQSYPPYNITKFDGGKFMVQIALAGFRKEDINITLEERTLTVSSEVEDNDNPKYGEVLHHGIAQRNFKQTFALAEYVEVDSARMEDGVLTIDLVTNIPDEKKPKVIEIN